jgi:hypothetical protein
MICIKTVEKNIRRAIISFVEMSRINVFEIDRCIYKE